MDEGEHGFRCLSYGSLTSNLRHPWEMCQHVTSTEGRGERRTRLDPAKDLL